MSKKTTIRRISILLIALGTLITVGSLVYGNYAVRLATPQPAPLPQQLADLPLQSHSFGEQAVLEINQMHNLEFPLVSGAVGHYGEGDQAVLWISGATNHLAAKRMLDDMTERINEGNSPFGITVERRIDGRTVYAMEGLGQEHFYFQSGTLLIWLAADSSIAEQALAESLAFYP